MAAKNINRQKTGSRKKRIMMPIAVVTFVLCAFFGAMTWRMHEEIKDNQVVVSQLEDQIDDAKEERINIQNQQAYMQTRDYYEDLARQKLGLIYENEIIFKKE